MKPTQTSIPTILGKKSSGRKSESILHRLNDQNSAINKRSPMVQPLPMSVNVDSLKTMDDCYAKLVEIVPSAQVEMPKADLLACVMDYIVELEDKLLDVFDLDYSLNLQTGSDDNLPAQFQNTTTTQRTPLKTLSNSRVLDNVSILHALTKSTFQLLYF